MPKLLLADDSPTTQKVVQLTFADEGIEVVVADDGDIAIELYEHHHPDIVLADINIPGLNGYEVCEAIRKRKDNGSTPVILLAGSFEPFDVEQAHRVGANDYLTKPFASIRRLVATVTALLDTAVRQDAAAEETIEPNSVPPHSTEAQTEHEPAIHSSSEPAQQTEPGPTLPPEPDPYATDDIQHLISQSFVETVEMPHTVAERVMGEISENKAEHQSEEPEDRRDDAAFDDELIETTFANEPDVSSVEQTYEAQHEAETEQPAEQLPGYGEITHAEPETAASDSSETYAPEHRIEPLGQEFEPPETGVAAPFSENTEPSAIVNTSELSQAPTEEFQIDQSGDETYFEPAAETVEQTDMIESSPAAEYSTHETESREITEQANEHVGPVFESEQLFVAEPGEPVAEHEPAGAFAGTEAESTFEQTPVPTPWDTVAEPPPPRFHLDESNLLELPIGYGSRAEETKPEHERQVTTAAAEIAPEIVDEIVRATASQISEELVREIANRIVPKVVEEVMARHRGEDNEH